MDNSTIWDRNFNEVYYIFKSGHKIQNSQLNTWFQIWTRAYKEKRMKNQDYVTKWEALLLVYNFNLSYEAYESFLKYGVKPSEFSSDKKQKKLALWFAEQSIPDKCVDNIRIDMLKTNYPDLFA